MARKYKRDARGRFAGGGAKVSGGGGFGAKVKSAAKKTGRFAKNNPDVVIALAYGAVSVGAGVALHRGGTSMANARTATARAYADTQNRSLSGPPTRLKQAHRSGVRQRVPKITSMR